MDGIYRCSHNADPVTGIAKDCFSIFLDIYGNPTEHWSGTHLLAVFENLLLFFLAELVVFLDHILLWIRRLHSGALHKIIGINPLRIDKFSGFCLLLHTHHTHH